MPLVRIEILKGRSRAEKEAVLEGVHAALMEALKIPGNDRTQRIIEHAPWDFETPPGKTERYTLIEITMFPGRSLDAKRHLYQAIVRNLAGAGVPPSDIFIVLHEPPMDNWGVRGGQQASEVDLGFKVNV